jgi:hypothetical protein
MAGIRVTIKGKRVTLTKKEFIPILAKFIECEGWEVAREYNDEICEPYRRGGDRLVDDALALIP